MSQVASESAAPPVSHAHQNPTRPSRVSGKAPATPFERMLDDTAPANDQPADAPTQAKPSEHAQKHQETNKNKTDTSAKSADHKTASDTDHAAKDGQKVVSADDTAKTEKTDKAAKDAKTTAKADEQATTGKAIEANNTDKAVETDKTGKTDKVIEADNTGKVGKAIEDDKTDKTGKGTKDDKDAKQAKDGAKDSGDAAVATAAAAAAATQAKPDATAVAIVVTPATPAAVHAATGEQKSEAVAGHEAGKGGKSAAPSQLATLQTSADATANADTPVAATDQTANKAAAPAQKDGEAAAAPDAGKKTAAPAHEQAAAKTAVTDAAALQPDAAKTGGNTTQPMMPTTAAQQTAPASAHAAANAAPPQQPAAPAVPLAGVALEIAGRALSGKNHFEIRLDPPELGRIEVRLDVGRDGHVTTHMVADRSDTLALLQRDASGLQRALQDAGLKTGDNGLQFSLRDQTAGQQQQTNTGNSAPLAGDDDKLAPIGIQPAALARYVSRAGGIDIRV